MDDPYAELRDDVLNQVLNGPGASEPVLRNAAASDAGLPADLQPLVDKIHAHAYRVTDDDVARAPTHLRRRPVVRDRRQRRGGRVAKAAARRTARVGTRMRLERVHRGHGFRDKLLLTMMRVVAGHAPGVVRTMRYRKEFFGKKWSELTHQVMRGPSSWPVGERELFAAFVSRLNQCVF